MAGGAARQGAQREDERKEQINSRMVGLSFLLLLKKRNKSKRKEELGGANKPQQKKREVGRACLCWGLWGGAHLPRLNCSH